MVVNSTLLGNRRHLDSWTFPGLPHIPRGNLWKLWTLTAHFPLPTAPGGLSLLKDLIIHGVPPRQVLFLCARLAGVSSCMWKPKVNTGCSLRYSLPLLFLDRDSHLAWRSQPSQAGWLANSRDLTVSA